MKGRAVEMAKRSHNIKRVMTGEEMGIEGARLPEGCTIEHSPITDLEQDLRAMIDDPKIRAAVERALNTCTNGNTSGSGR